jgi:hypothetical protein
VQDKADQVLAKVAQVRAGMTMMMMRRRRRRRRIITIAVRPSQDSESMMISDPKPPLEVFVTTALPLFPRRIPCWLTTPPK